ncbi:MAG: SDR family oxidoreductase [Chloroflexota bacterium]
MPNFDLHGKVAVVTGGSGVLGSAICRALADEGATVVVLSTRQAAAESLARELGSSCVGFGCNVLEKDSLQPIAQSLLERFGRVDILINAAGGNKPEATTSPEQSFFDLPAEAIRGVFDLNLTGTVLACQVFGRIMAEQKEGVILNISSMNAFRPLTRIPAYSAAKAAVSNFTQWLAVHMAQEYSPNIRVNAIAPGFFISRQNRRLLLNEDGTLTKRGQQILAHTPMGRFGIPEDLLGAVIWLVSPASAFVTGTVIPIDGGFAAFSGV